LDKLFFNAKARSRKAAKKFWEGFVIRNLKELYAPRYFLKIFKTFAALRPRALALIVNS
jgi:hypothetical protein